MSQEIIFYKKLSYEFGKDVQRLETEVSKLKDDVAFHKGEAAFYREQFHAQKKPSVAADDVPKIFRKRDVSI